MNLKEKFLAFVGWWRQAEPQFQVMLDNSRIVDAGAWAPVEEAVLSCDPTLHEKYLELMRLNHSFQERRLEFIAYIRNRMEGQSN